MYEYYKIIKKMECISNHIVVVMCVPDVQHKDDVKMPTTKSTGTKQTTLFALLKPLPSNQVLKEN